MAEAHGDVLAVGKSNMQRLVHTWGTPAGLDGPTIAGKRKEGAAQPKSGGGAISGARKTKSFACKLARIPASALDSGALILDSSSLTGFQLQASAGGAAQLEGGGGGDDGGGGQLQPAGGPCLEPRRSGCVCLSVAGLRAAQCPVGKAFARVWR